MAASFVQSASNTSVLASVTATFGATPKAGNLLLAGVVSNVGAAATSITGYTSAVNVVVNILGSVDIFYKIAGASESTSVTASATAATLIDLHLFEFSGFNSTTGSVLDVTASGADAGVAVTSRSSGTTGTTNLADELVFAVVGSLGPDGGGVSWTNGYTLGITTTDLMSAYLITTATGTQTTTASWTTLQRSAGVIATFQASTGNKGINIKQ